MQAPTSTPTPPPDPTPTPTPVPGPYWERFTQAEYDQFLPPKGAHPMARTGNVTSPNVGHPYQLN